MKDWEGKQCKIHIRKDKIDLFYTVKKVISVSDSHITFIDKFDETFTYNIDMIEEIHKLKEDEL